MSNKSELIAVRLPLELVEKIKAYGLENYPKDCTFDKTKTIIDLIEKGLINQPQDNNNNTVIQDVIQTVNTNDSSKLESYIDEIKEAQNAINDKIYQRLEALENILNYQSNSLIDENKKELNAITILEKLDNLTDIASNLKEGELIFSDKELRELNDLELDMIYQKFKEVGHFGVGWSDDSNNKRMTLLKCKMNKGIFKQEQPPADQVGTSQETDTPDPLVIEVNDSLLNTLTPDQQSVVMAIIEEKSENEIKSLIPTGKNQQYLRKLAKVLGFKKTSTMGINKLIPLMKNCLIIANI